MIGTAAGGGSDLMARLDGQRLTQAWNAAVVVEPRPGVGGNIAAEFVAKSAPDGYTLYVCFGTHTVNPNLYAKAGYEAIRDFAPSRIDLLRGHVDLMFDVLRTALPFREAGRIRMLAVASSQRSSLAMDLPTMAEAGWKGIEVLTWHALLAPAGIRPD